MSPKLVVRLKGGLGNQLFCYAAARRLAWVNDAELVLDAVTGFKYDHLYRRQYALGAFCIPARLATPAEQMEPWGRVRRLLSRKMSERKPLSQRRYIQQVGVDFDPELLALRLQPGMTYFDAFGQSERYFSDIGEIIRRDLAMQVPLDPQDRDLLARIQEGPSVALHVRWFDAGDSPDSSNMSRAYYEKAMRLLMARLGSAHFYVFSDHPDQAQAMLVPLMQGQPCTLVRHNALSGNAVGDFGLMRQCRHFIISNSTFAWWAAWLGERERSETLVFAPAQSVDPERSVTAWGFPHLLPQRWISL